MKRIIFIAILHSLFSLGVSGQDIIKPGMHSKNLNLQNPAFVAIDKDSHSGIDLYGRYKFAKKGWNKDPNAVLSYSGRNKRAGGFYSAIYSYDNYSYYNRHTFSLGYGTIWNMSEGRSLRAGIRGVFNFDNIEWHNIYNYRGDGQDRSMHMTPDLDIGIEYNSGRVRTGLSVRNVVGVKRDFRRDGVVLYNRRMLFFDITYNLPLGEVFEMEYHASVYVERNYTADLGFSIKYRGRYHLLYNFRLLELRHIAGFQIDFNHVNIGIIYDASHLHSDRNIDMVLGFRF